MTTIYEQITSALASPTPFALGIISRINGSSPQKKGAKALFFEDGRIIGTLGGGCLEAEIQDRARRSLQSGQPTTFELVLDHDFGWDDGLICGGKVTGLILPRPAAAKELWQMLAKRESTIAWGVREDFAIMQLQPPADTSLLYEETVCPPYNLWIAGSGHVAQAVAPLALNLDFQVTVLDDRPSLANHQFFPESVRFRIGAWEELLREAVSKPQLFGLIVTRGHHRDALVLSKWIREPFAFLGLIGSRRKKRLIFEQFVQEGIATEQKLASVACPVGIDIGSQTVPEIAISIAAQLVERRAELRRCAGLMPTRGSEPLNLAEN